MAGLDEHLTVLTDKIEAVEVSLLVAKSDSDIAYLREKERQLREEKIILLRRQDASVSPVLNPNDSAWKTIVTSGYFSSQEDAWLLYSDAERIPQTQTRAEALSDLDLKIDGAIQVPGIQTAVFLYAFLKFLPMVLKIPRVISKVVKECKLYESIGTMAEKAEIALVPVESIRLKGHRIRDGSAAKL